MGFIEGKRIQALSSLKEGCKDFVIKEEVKEKTFLLFVLPETARKIMAICEDLIMKPLREKKWEMSEKERMISMEVTSNWRGNSLAISSVTKSKQARKRRVFIPEGEFGEGWLSLARQFKDLLRRERVLLMSSVPRISAVDPLQQTKRNSWWMSIPAQPPSPNRFGNWAFAVVCRVHYSKADWSKIQHRITELVGDFILSPFDSMNALIQTSSAEEQDLLCGYSASLEISDNFSLVPWSPGINGIKSLSFSIGGWIGLLGLPFHLWNETIFADIGKLFGNLVSFDDNDLSMLKLKVGGDLSWIPSRLDIQEGDEIFQLEIRVINELEKTAQEPEKTDQVSPENCFSVEDENVVSPTPPLGLGHVAESRHLALLGLDNASSRVASTAVLADVSRVRPASPRGWASNEENFGEASLTNRDVAIKSKEKVQTFRHVGSSRIQNLNSVVLVGNLSSGGSLEVVPSSSPSEDFNSLDTPTKSLLNNRLSVGLELGLTSNCGTHKIRELLHRAHTRDELELAKSKEVLIETLPEASDEEVDPQTPLAEFSAETPLVVFPDKVDIEWWEDSQLREDFQLQDSVFPSIPPGFESVNLPPPGFETAKQRRKALLMSILNGISDS